MVYVDDALIGWRGKHWCHMQADTLDELHAFAERLGLKREWFQSKPGRPDHDHYDVTEAKAQEAFRMGAIPESIEAGAKRRKAIRQRLTEQETRDG